MVRITPFPVLFSGCLIVFGVGFYYRKTLFCESEEVIRQKQNQSFIEAQEHRRQLEEGLKKIKEAKLAAKNNNE